jgi:hypothetical protein
MVHQFISEVNKNEAIITFASYEISTAMKKEAAWTSVTFVSSHITIQKMTNYNSLHNLSCGNTILSKTSSLMTAWVSRRVALELTCKGKVK